MDHHNEANLSPVGHRLVTWYRQHHRPLPWRQTRDPYRILVSETMLQQTRVDTVIPYYHAFLEAFPTLTALATADEESVMKLWQGLGYYSRARNLHKAAKAAVQLHAGTIPNDIEAVQALPGVGPYTTGAVMSIAFDQPVPAVDGNVLRVVARHRGIHDEVQSTKAKRDITQIVTGWLEGTPPADFTQAVMELGAMVCTPRQPQCATCPIAGDCIAYAQGLTDELPHKAVKAARKVVHVLALWIELDGRVLMEKRPDTGLLQGMWQLPAWEGSMAPFTQHVTEVLGNRVIPSVHHDIAKHITHDLDTSMLQPCADFVAERPMGLGFTKLTEEKHIFTHVEWHVGVYRPVGLQLGELQLATDRKLEFIAKQDIHQLVLPRVYEKIFESILGERMR